MSLLRSRRMLGSLLLCAMGGLSLAAPVKKTARAPVVPVVMLSDIHFDPFHDPLKFERLRAAPMMDWQGILAEPDHPNQPADFAKLLSACKTRGVDTPWTLMESSLAAAHAQSPHALFVTVSGDLLVHQFDCRFHLLAKGAKEEEYSAFAAKTLAYVASELHRTFGPTPVYIALGNNDSGCGDYREMQNSSFLHSAAESFGDDVQSERGRKDVLGEFTQSGDYSLELPKPVVRGRLIVLQDVFLSAAYVGCNGKPDAAPGATEVDWLRSELAAAHARHEQVWVMAHIPTGVNVYSTVQSNRNVCGGQAPAMFLRDEKLAEALTDFAADIRLVIFAHTHMDEMRLLHGMAPADGKPVAKAAAVAVKLVPSVTPINGNYPAFTLAEVQPRTAVLKDYRVVAADNMTGVAAKWTEEYRYSTTYHRTAFRPEDVAAIVSGFHADRDSAKPETQAYEQNLMVGGGLRAMAMRLVWPETACAMDNNTVEGYRACVCPTKP